ncbi:hypothetical protein ITG09_22625 [Vibrio cyclitrophicus]|nr:hypothetical protein [Vibrio cyclitrophicus]UPR54172.1 hypothetical protein ITG09_22625 [Vibrio cyclitrophicus]
MKTVPLIASISLLLLTSNAFAQQNTSDTTDIIQKTSPQEVMPSTESATPEKVQDMSDPLAVYTQAGFGISDKGLNIKIGQSYDTGSDITMGMNIVEIKGVAGEQLGWSGSNHRDDSIDSVRFRNFTVDKTNGQGKQIDLNYSVEQEQLDASYSFIQALPKWGAIQLYPLAGVGARIMNGQVDKVVDTDSGAYEIDTSVGYTIPGVYAVVGMYSRITVTENIWINYNPMWLTSIAGSDSFVDQGMAGDSNIFTNELSISYQLTPRFNARYYANWTQDQDYFEGDQRIEFNYQF